MNTVDRCDLLPRFTFCHAPSVAQRVDLLRASKCANLYTGGPVFRQYPILGQCKSQFLQDSDAASGLDNAKTLIDSTSCSSSCASLVSEEISVHDCDGFQGARFENWAALQPCERGIDTPQVKCTEDSSEPKRCRMPSWSSGATNHQAGHCHPCAWNWKPDGCNKGANCEFCHMCEEGIAKLRKQKKIAVLRYTKLSKRAPTSKVITSKEVPLPPGLLKKTMDEHERVHGAHSDMASTSNGSSTVSPISCESHDSCYSTLPQFPSTPIFTVKQP